MTRYSLLFVLPTAALAAITLAACSSSSSTTPAAGSPGTATTSSAAFLHGNMPGMTAPSGNTASSGNASAAHNAADAMFATMMIPHHAQAIEMAKLAATRASSADVKTLALKIEGAQQPEITKMSGWLTAWGMPVPSVSMGGMDMGGGTGMMSAGDMTGLAAALGPAFDKSFLTLMIAHHQGAIVMADSEVRSGQSADALTLAKAIQTDQAAEIAQMQTLLKK